MGILGRSFSYFRRFGRDLNWMLMELNGCNARIRDLDERIRQLDQEFKGILNLELLARRINPTRKHVWHVAALKTGSTWLTMSLNNLLGWPHNWLALNGWDRREQVVDFRKVLYNRDGNLLSLHQHCPFSATEKEFIDRFRVRVILQGRNLFDTVVSAYDHLRKISPSFASAYFDDSFANLSPERQMDAVIDLTVPWYLRFYCSWFAARDRGEVTYEWVTYEDLLADPTAVLRRILVHLGEIRTDEQIVESLQNASKRGDEILRGQLGAPLKFNVGKVGRGEAMLSSQQKDRIRHLRSYYPHIDLSPIGL